MNQESKYIVCEATDYGCKVNNVVNTESGNRINYFTDDESAKDFAELQNSAAKKRITKKRMNQKEKDNQNDTWGDLGRVKTIFESLEEKVESGKITIREAAIELHKAGWTNYIDIDATKRLLGLN